MDFDGWEPIYLQIMEDMGYSLQADEMAAKLLDSLCPRGRICDDACISNIISDVVTVVGHSPDLEEQLVDLEPFGTLIAADGATSQLVDEGFLPDIIVTDLDGDLKMEMECNAKGSLSVVHAHGDNMEVIESIVPKMEGMITPTVQCRPFGCLSNFGGFTDGDRAIHLAEHFGARRVYLVGFDFERPRVKDGGSEAEKLKKLAWARRMILGIGGRMEVMVRGQENWQLFTDVKI